MMYAHSLLSTTNLLNCKKGHEPMGPSAVINNTVLFMDENNHTFMIKRKINEEIIILLLQQVKIGDWSDVSKNIPLSLFIAQ